MRRDVLYLTDIVEAAEAIQTFLKDIEKKAFLDNDLIRSAVLQKLLVIGEAASRLSSEFRQNYPDVPWRDIVAFRNIAIHAYFSIEWPIVWVTASKDVPELRQQVAALLNKLPKDNPA